MDVVGTDIRTADDTPKPCIQADLKDQYALTSMIDGCDAVVHAGNHANNREDVPPEQIYLENVTMNTHVFQAAEDAGVGCIIFTSSIQVISGKRHVTELDEPSCLTRLPLDGLTPPCPGCTYALSKLAGEQALQYLSYLHPERSYTTLRFPWLTGRREDLGHAKPSEPIKPVWLTKADEAYAYLTKADAADLILAVLQKRLTGYHQYMPVAGNCLGLTPEEMVEQFYPEVPIAEGDRPLKTLFDISQIQADLGWAPQGVDLFRRAVEPSG